MGVLLRTLDLLPVELDWGDLWTGARAVLMLAFVIEPLGFGALTFCY